MTSLSSPLAPFPVETNHPEMISGDKSETYIDRIGICFAVTPA
jgi:hypothetical protein